MLVLRCVVLQVYDSLTSRGVLVSEWIEGRKLSSLNRNDKVGRERDPTLEPA